MCQGHFNEFLAVMLGVRRATVSVAAAALQDPGLIRNTLGRVTVRHTGNVLVTWQGVLDCDYWIQYIVRPFSAAPTPTTSLANEDAALDRKTPWSIVFTASDKSMSRRVAPEDGDVVVRQKRGNPARCTCWHAVGSRAVHTPHPR
jgi:hypothetical protein